MHPLLQPPPSTQSTVPIIVVVGVVYFLAVAAIGVWATGRIRSTQDFFLAGKGIGLLALALSAMASTLSGFAFVGGPGLVYATGVGAVFLVLPAAVTGTLGAWVLAKRMRLLADLRGCLTVPDAIRVRFDSRCAQGLSGIAILAATVGYMATNLLALGVVIEGIFGIGLAPAIWIGTLIVMAYSTSGGMVAGIYTDMLQGALMALASGLVFLFVLDVGDGFAGLSRAVLAADPAWLASWGTRGPLAALSLFFVFGVGSLGQPHVVHKYYMIRDPRRLRWFPALMTVAVMVSLLLYFGVGFAVKALVARGDLPSLASPDDATPTFLLRYTPAALAAVVFSGVAAAIMSTLNSFMNIGAAVVTHDLPRALGRRVRNELAWGRLATVVLSLAAALAAQFPGALVALLGIFGWGLFASTLVPSLAIGLNWTGATRAGAIASIATGLGVTVGLETLLFFGKISLPSGAAVSGMALAGSLAVFLVVSWWTGPRPVDPAVEAVLRT